MHLHIPKTGGMTLGNMVRHAFANNEAFETPNQVEFTGLGLPRYERCVEHLVSLPAHELNCIRYVWGHAPFGLHRIFQRPAKYFTVIRHPVDRLISWFFYLAELNEPYLEDGRPLSLEKYVQRGLDINMNNYQVRVVSGCQELDTGPPGIGEQAVAAPVERHHLEEAKRNIESHFLAAAPFDHMTDLALLLRLVYHWPMHRFYAEHLNRTKRRPAIKDVPPRLIKLIEDHNLYDMELYEWVAKRFEAQRQQFEPKLSRDRCVFGPVNYALTKVGKAFPYEVRKRLAKSFFYA
jgi:hypothetical protein